MTPTTTSPVVGAVVVTTLGVPPVDVPLTTAPRKDSNISLYPTTAMALDAVDADENVTVVTVAPELIWEVVIVV
jgi:hypothetical protein